MMGLQSSIRAFAHICLFYSIFALAWLLFVIATFTPEQSHAQSLTVSPNRIILEGRNNKDRALVSNPGETKKSYRVQLLNRRMEENGKYVTVEEGDERPDELFADKLIRISPRSFTLEPKTSQTIRLRLRKPRDLPEGEYRSHLRVQVLPDTSAPQTLPGGGRIGISVRVNYGITIPIIVRNGTLNYDAAIKTIEVSKDSQNNRYILKSQFTREGTRSTYGDISIVFTDANGEEHLLKYLAGLSIFYPNKTRTFNIPLDVPEGLELKNGNLKITYRTQESEGSQIMAERTVNLQ